jgi:glycosyltransferase involved in cell wall biosynthesis
MLISVIVPVYNAEKYIKACADSILSQTYSNIELILVDDGSKDKSPQICDEIADKDSRVKVCHQKNAGVSAARNKGMELATGEYVAFVDNDDIMPPKALESYVSVMGEDRPLLIQGNVAFTDTHQKAVESDFPSDPDKKKYVSPVDFFYRNGVSKSDVWGKLFHKSMTSKYKYPEGHYFEDLYFNGLVITDTELKNVLVTENIVYTHFDNNDSASHLWDEHDAVDSCVTVKELYDKVAVKTDNVQLINAYYKITFTLWASFRYNVVLRNAYKGEAKKQLKAVRKSIIKLLPKSKLPLKDKIICLGLVSNNALYRAYIIKRDPTMKVYEKNVKEKLKSMKQK